MTQFRDVIGVVVGRNIAHRRRQLGITEDQFSRCLGVERTVLDQYETGARRVDAKLLLSIGLILDVPPMYFFSNPETDHQESQAFELPKPDLETDRALFLRDGVALNRAFARIRKSRNRQVLIDIAHALADIDRLP